MRGCSTDSMLLEAEAADPAAKAFWIARTAPNFIFREIDAELTFTVLVRSFGPLVFSFYIFTFPRRLGRNAAHT